MLFNIVKYSFENYFLNKNLYYVVLSETENKQKRIENLRRQEISPNWSKHIEDIIKNVTIEQSLYLK